MAKALTILTGDNACTWRDAQQETFDTLKHALTHAPALRCYKPGDSMRIHADASDHAISGALSVHIEQSSAKLSTTRARAHGHRRTYQTLEGALTWANLRSALRPQPPRAPLRAETHAKEASKMVRGPRGL
eukprot:Plantae.Rhodophyta-Hildenbrandia_rubra.ctg25674.p1 GENE.Plantae.Rhodophyta-Hildenbrandia_rubra.ctg25674~~Plantae.Rhodophyta-Hildenbrandia_rubra.ctg25674.p1  ORF type:complete len:131 (-),score=5.27 Plantae.Rhodophyta-Hildenbrandia_rubra.ctg25674:625-1017(-)